MKRPVALLLLLALPLADARADEVVLAGGSRLSGVVLGRDDAGLDLLLPPGTVLRLLAADVREVRADPDAPAPGRHLRFREPGPAGEGLEVAVTHLVHPGGGPRVDLVAAVHIADPAYFREVQRLLEAADVVLYEGIKPAGAAMQDLAAPAAAEQNPVRALQQNLARWFGLSFQLDALAYGRPHFVHADLTAEEFADELGGSAKEGGEGAAGSAGGREFDFVRRQMEALAPMLESMLGQPGPMRDNVKRMMARMLGAPNALSLIGALLPNLSGLLIAKRNEVVVAKVAELRATAKGTVAVLYGAAHMSGVEAALVERLGYRRAGGRWLRAWDTGTTR